MKQYPALISDVSLLRKKLPAGLHDRLSTGQQIRGAALVEGNSLRATARMTAGARMTIEELLRDLGTVCAIYQDGPR